MLFRHEIQVPPGFEVVVNDRIVSDRRRILVGAYDRVYFVSFASCYADVACEATCKEGLVHKLSAIVKIAIDRNGLHGVLRDAGHSTYRRVAQVTAEGLLQREHLLESIKASVRSYAHDTGFFALADLENVKQEINRHVSAECAKSRLTGEVVSCDVVRCLPDQGFVAQLAAMAGVTETTQDNMRIRRYRDDNLGRIVDYFIETLRQQELIQAEAERARAGAELARLDAQSQVAAARADLKIREIEEQNRISARHAELAEEEARRQEAVQNRNAQIKDNAAKLEHLYNMQRSEEAKALASRAAEVAQARNDEQLALREQKRQDMLLEREHQRELAMIRAGEKGELFVQVTSLVEKLTHLPLPDVSNARTIINSGPGSFAEPAAGLLTALLSKLVERCEL